MSDETARPIELGHISKDLDLQYDIESGDRLDIVSDACILQRSRNNWLLRFADTQAEKRQDAISQEVRSLFARWLRMENVSLLVGAGASKYVAGFVMSGLHDRAAALLKGRESEKTLERLKDYCSQPENISTQFESLLSQLAAWRSLAEPRKLPLDKFLPEFPSPRKGKDLITCGIIDKLLTDLERAILVACNLSLPASELCSPGNASCKWQTTPHEALLAKMVARDPLLGRTKVFTINYDTLIEQALDRLGILYCDGFTGTVTRQFNPSAYDLDFYYPGEATEGKVKRFDKVVHLYKLHGSINWRVSSTPSASGPYGIEFDSTQFPRAAELDGANPQKLDSIFASGSGLAILPTANKYGESLAMPYAHMFRAFSAALRMPQTVLMILGYGGWDEHINRLVEDALTNPSFTCVIVGPEPSDWTKRLCRADACGRVFYMGGKWAKFEYFAQHVLPDLETLKTELDIARTMRDLRKFSDYTPTDRK